MRPVHITKHARKRIENDKRTQLTIEEVVSLIQSPHTLKIGQTHYVYSKKDRKTLKVITGKQDRVLITVYDTSREPSRLGDMVGRALAGETVTFTELPPPKTFSEEHASSLTLGTSKVRLRKDGSSHLHIKDLYEVGSVYNAFMHIEGALENRFIHELVVDATAQALREGSLSRTQIKRLTFFVDDRINRHIGYLPVWISFALLGLEFEGGIYIPR